MTGVQTCALPISLVREPGRRGRAEFGAIGERPRDAKSGVVEFDLIDLAGVHLGDELLEADLLAVRPGEELRPEDEEHDDREEDRDPAAALRSLGFPSRDARELVATVAADPALRNASLTDRLRAALKERA